MESLIFSLLVCILIFSIFLIAVAWHIDVIMTRLSEIEKAGKVVRDNEKKINSLLEEYDRDRALLTEKCDQLFARHDISGEKVANLQTRIHDLEASVERLVRLDAESRMP